MFLVAHAIGLSFGPREPPKAARWLLKQRNREPPYVNLLWLSAA